MTKGRIQAWPEEDRWAEHRPSPSGKARSTFRRGFTTTLRASDDEDADPVAELRWGDEVQLPDGLGDGDWTRADVDGEEGFVPTDHVVELAWVAAAGSENDDFTAELEFEDGDTYDLLWGDSVQILERADDRCRVRARGMRGHIEADRLTDEPLLELYFIDVGQGDGVLIRTPSGRHMLVDGGLPRANQMTGKNAADFVDWKFHVDYGHWAVELDSLMASHCDADHFGGLWDLVELDPVEDDELDCVGVRIAEFHHAGLSRWRDREGAEPPHTNDLGPNVDSDWFVRLLEDRADAEGALADDADEELGGWWRDFIEDLLERQDEALVTRVGVPRETLEDGGPLPRIWPDEEDLEIRVLAPVTVEHETGPALPDLGDRGQNTNGHSICLRLDHGGVRILLTGDLNKKSMDWLAACYGDRIGAFECDVTKACHHGSHDVSYRFLEHVAAAATVISSGDAEGHAHPRPEIVAASAASGHVTVDREEDRLLTPLVYSTEVERSVSLGQVTHVRFHRYPAPAAGGDGEPEEDADEDGEPGSDSEDEVDTFGGALFAMPVDEISDSSLPTRYDRWEMSEATEDEAEEIEEEAVDRERDTLEELAARQWEAWTRADYHVHRVHELFWDRYETHPVWRSRIMTENHYGLVNVRTDGERVLCATMREAGGGWTVQTFPGRFGD